MPKIFRPFEEAMNFVWQWEGGFSNDKDDPGGATNFGITLATARANGLDIDGDGDIDIDDIRKMTPEAAYAVYKNKYWSPIFNAVSDIPWDLAIVAFDAAVNCGPERVVGWVKEAIKQKNPAKALNQARRVYYNTIISKNPTLRKYKQGWENRVLDLEKLLTIRTRELTDGDIALLDLPY